MTRLLRAAPAAAALAFLAACSSGGNGDPAAGSTPTTGTVCSNTKWPQRIPDAAGRNLTDVTLGKPGDSSALTCFNVTQAVAPDGHNVLDDAGDDVQAWTVKSSTPAAGTTVDEDTPITLRLTYPN
ncbi:hypothetical protein [Streptomyces sp. NPDC050738]|uniref:hypothetical protein n=1 Tax=Streptomyces sp. NPDC050738 TaxID=3154744 RepID=UPI00342D5DCF